MRGLAHTRCCSQALLGGQRADSLDSTSRIIMSTIPVNFGIFPKAKCGGERNFFTQGGLTPEQLLLLSFEPNENTCFFID